MGLPVEFTHLRVHSWFTLLGATASPQDLAARAASDGLHALALTDRNALHGAVGFVRACEAAGVRPILGMIVGVGSAWGQLRSSQEGPGELVLLADGPEGYRSLSRLSSLILGGPDRGRFTSAGLSWETLAEHRRGLVCLEGGRLGWLGRFLASGNERAARDYLARLADLYPGACYLCLELHRPEDAATAEAVAALGERYGLPAVAVQPVYCLQTSERDRLRVLAAMRLNVRLEEVPDRALPDRGDDRVDLHWLSPFEMNARFKDHPEALARAAEVAERCRPALQQGPTIWPTLRLPEGTSPETALAAAAGKGLRERYGGAPRAEAHARLDRELEAILRHGFAPLFLIVADIVRFAREDGVPVSTRGSVANSLVAYCIGITDVDPIEHDLLFERFLNPARASPPDIDLDFCSRRRDRVLEYVRRTYGEDRVALVGTVMTLRLKGAVREVAKAYGLDEPRIKELTSELRSRWHPDPRRRSAESLESLLGRVADPAAREVIRTASEITGQPRHFGLHPGGLVITPGPLADFVPVQMAAKGFLATQFDHPGVEAVGLPKMDLLGIRALTVMADAAVLVRRREPAFRLEGISTEDASTGDLLERAETIGVFQCESEGAQRTLRKLKARSVRDLAVANAFFKPGPATGGQAAAFVRRYRGEQPVRYLHPALEPILGPTQGVLIFQEQILRVGTEIAGLTWAQADRLRKGMSKFRPEEIEALRETFLAGCRRAAPDGPGFTVAQADTLWEQVSAFAGYGFNQGHATAYAGVSYRSAYLKAHYPAEFLCARLASAGGFHHPAIYMAEAVRLGIPVRPPHVNHSRRRFTLKTEDKEGGEPVLWMGLGWVRDLRRGSIQSIVRERRAAPFSDVRDLLARVPLQAKEVEHLVQCGALDGLGECRAAVLAEARGADRAGDVRQRAFAFVQAERVPCERADQRLAWERAVLGLPVSVHPLELIEEGLDGAVPLRRLERGGGAPAVIAGARLPGWTGGEGFFFGDGDDFVIVKAAEGVRLPSLGAWQAACLRGRWLADEWGGGWFQAEAAVIL